MPILRAFHDVGSLPVPDFAKPSGQLHARSQFSSTAKPGERGEAVMQELLESIDQWVMSLMRRQPAKRPRRLSNLDWLPPVLGPSEWSSGMMASLADKSADWYYDRAA